MKDFSQESKRLQKLSCITLTSDEEKKLNDQLGRMIEMLDTLPMVEESTPPTHTGQVTLRTIAGQKDADMSEMLLQNVHHDKINNSIVIKSVLS